ncbi:MAG: carboxypeptidase regulatory-like domain-containing protein, partial [Marinifilaceae bacterium]|nr:carboxypeptidase regulatory-like domain-containing protein [Marinifilaceae bacterium]
KGRSNSVLGSVVLAGSGEPIKGAMVRFTGETTGETPKVFEKKSSDKGNFRMKLPEGTYRVMVSKIGCLDREFTVVVANGETTNVKVELTLGKSQ